MWPWLKRATASQVHAGSTSFVPNVAALSMGAAPSVLCVRPAGC